MVIFIEFVSKMSIPLVASRFREFSLDEVSKKSFGWAANRQRTRQGNSSRTLVRNSEVSRTSRVSLKLGCHSHFAVMILNPM